MALFKKLLVGSLVMLVFGYMGEAGIMAAWPAFIIGCLAWVYMIYELWAGEGKSACNTASPAVQSAYNTMMYDHHLWLGYLSCRLFHRLPNG